MAVFVYRALRKNGERVSGEVNASSKTEAFRALERQNLQPISLVSKDGGPVTTDSGKTLLAKGPISLNRAQIILFTDELSDLLEAGLQLEPALHVMEQRQELSRLKDLTVMLRQQLREGTSFSTALRNSCKSFDDLYCNLAQAGEISGALPEILRRQAGFLIAMQDLQSKVSQSLIYPAFIAAAGVILLFVFMTFLVPQLTTLFQKTGGGLPLATQILVSTSSFFARFWWLMLGIVGLIGMGFYSFIQQPNGKKWWDVSRLKIPIVGDVLRAKFYTQFAQTLSTMVSNGIPLLNGLRLMKDATGNLFLGSIVAQLVDIVAEGGALSRAMRRVGNFPALMIDMVVVGEQTGDLGVALAKIGKRYDKELNKATQRIAAVVPPTVIIVLALVVGVVAWSMITGILQAVSGLRVRT